jgi:hypothetical protein
MAVTIRNLGYITKQLFRSSSKVMDETTFPHLQVQRQSFTILGSVNCTTKYSFTLGQLCTQKMTNMPINHISFSVFTVGITKTVVF